MITRYQETDTEELLASSGVSLNRFNYPLLKAMDVTSGIILGTFSASIGLDNLDRQPWNYIHQIRDKRLVAGVNTLLIAIRRTAMSFPPSVFESRDLPPLHAFSLDDGSTLIEWIFTDFRIGFNVEPNPEESSWYLASNRNLGELNASGYISNPHFNRLLLWLFNFALLNS